MMREALNRPPLTLPQAEQMLGYIRGAESREVWLQVGMGLKDEFGDVAFDAWDRWSQDARNYDPRACQASWRGFRARPAGVTIGTVIKLATEGGFSFVKDDVDDAKRERDMAELARRRAERAQRIKNEQAEREQRSQMAESRAISDWRGAARDGSSEYAAQKGLARLESVRYGDGGCLLVPMLRYDLPREKSLKGLQHIFPDGRKRFTPGAAKAGAACRLGLPVVGEPVLVCEGWATGMSLRMAIEHLTGSRRWPVFVAFDAYNLPIVCELVHKMLPSCPMVICGDDDWQTKVNGDPHNVGAVQAQVAQESVLDAGARLVVRMTPLFCAQVQRGEKDTDFNDLHRLQGLPAVAEQMQVALECIQELEAYA